ncbi:MAG: Ig-like domain-containing protein [Patescibacteria group bacterium]
MNKNSLKTLIYGVVSAMVIAPLLPIMAYAAPTDSSPPVVSIVSPANGASVFGTVTIAATATDLFSSCVINLYGKQYDVTPLQPTGAHPGGNVFLCGQNNDALYFGMHGTDVTRMIPYLLPTTYTGVTKVEFYIDGALASTDTSLAYSYDWNTAAVSNGAHTLQAKAYDGVNVSNSSVVNVTVNNAGSTTSTPPTSNITTPGPSTVSGTIMVAADATGVPSVAKVEFYVDGILKYLDITNPYSFAWDTTLETNGPHTLQAKAYDPASNIGNSTLILVTVNNVTSTPTTPPPVTPPTSTPTSTPNTNNQHHDDDEDDHEDENEIEIHDSKNSQGEQHRSVRSLNQTRTNHSEQEDD